MKLKLVLTLTLLIALAAPAHALTVLCNGDSNTAAGTLPADVRWCERLGVLANVDTINRGVGGSAAPRRDRQQPLPGSSPAGR